MYTTIAALLTLAASAVAAPLNPTTCAPGTGYYQNCANGYSGCSTTDMCSPRVPGPDQDPTTVCAPGTGYYQVCEATGFSGCSAEDMCSPAQSLPQKTKRWTCEPGTGYYQKCANGYEGCSTADMCSPTTWTPPSSGPVDDLTSSSVCAPGMGYYQVCQATGFVGCSTEDMCTPKPLGHPQAKRWTCATGYYQKCANGFDGCSKEDECSKKAGAWDSDAPVQPPVQHVPAAWPIPANNGVCAPGTGYYQVCNSGAIKGCCKQDMCGLGYCPYPN